MKNIIIYSCIFLLGSCSSAPYLHIAPNEDGIGSIRTTKGWFAGSEASNNYIKKICNGRYQTLGVTISETHMTSLTEVEQSDFRCLKKKK